MKGKGINAYVIFLRQSLRPLIYQSKKERGTKYTLTFTPINDSLLASITDHNEKRFYV